MVRMMGLETAVTMLAGQERLASAMGITPRALKYKLNAERGISDDDLAATAAALDARADHLKRHARKLRDQIAAAPADARQIDIEDVIASAPGGVPSRTSAPSTRKERASAD